MGYDYYNHLPRKVRITEVKEFLALLGYQASGSERINPHRTVCLYYHFKEEQFESYTGVSAAIADDAKAKEIVVNFHTKIFCSKYDLEYQTFTVRQLVKRFGGYFVSDRGRGRYIQFDGVERKQADAGCYRAFSNFGFSINRAKAYLAIREFKGDQWKEVGKIEELDVLNPMLLANNLLVPYLVSCAEEYFRSTFIALLKYSNRKQQVMKSLRIPGDFLLSAYDDPHPIETAAASSLSFQNLDSICNHFKTIDNKLDLASVMRQPYRRRKQPLFDSLRDLIEHRHKLIHRNILLTSYTEERVSRDITDLENAIKRVYRAITHLYGWVYDDFY